MEREVWKSVAGFLGYEVSNRGRVRSFREPKLLSAERRSCGHLSVWLMRNGKPRRRAVHRLVLNAFAGPPRPGYEGCHNDGNPRNNYVDNLRWDTHRANMLDKKLHGTQPAGANHHAARVTVQDARRMKALLARGWSGARVAEAFGVSGTTVSEVKRGRHWTSLRR